MVPTKYGFTVSAETVSMDINRLTNQLWKLIPMRENKEDWIHQLNTVIIEIAGLNEIFSTKSEQQLIILLSKLEGLRIQDTTFEVYRKTVFETISLLREMRL